MFGMSYFLCIFVIQKATQKKASGGRSSQISTEAKVKYHYKVKYQFSVMKTFQTIEAAANLKGMAKHTYNRVMSAMAEDNDRYMGHTFAALTDGAKAIAHNSGKFSNLYIRGERKGMTAEEAAKELTERAAGCVSRKLRNIDRICAVAFLAEYISRQRKADEPTTPEPNNTPTTMNANEIRESISRLRYELQKYHDNACKGGTERRRNMLLLRWDIRKLERQLKAMESETRTKSMKAKSAKDLERQIASISGARFYKALEIYKRYLHNMAVYFSGDKYPMAPAMTPDQLKIKVPQSIYAAI